MDWRHIAACRDETRSCSSRSATPVPPCCRSRKPSRSAVAARSAKSACSSRWRPDRTPACGVGCRGRASSTETTQRPGEGARLLSRFDCAPPALRLAGRFDGRVPTGPTDPRAGGRGPPTRLGSSARTGPTSSVPASSPTTKVRTICSPSRPDSSTSNPGAIRGRRRRPRPEASRPDGPRPATPRRARFPSHAPPRSATAR